MNNSYTVYPVYNMYAASKKGKIIHIVRLTSMIGTLRVDGSCMDCQSGQSGQSGQNCYLVYKLIYDCYRGLIPDGYVIGHINNIKSDNTHEHLQHLTPKENRTKYVDSLEHFLASSHQKKKNYGSQEQEYFWLL